MLTSATVRVGGAALLAIGVVLGVRWLGAEQFGLSVVALAAGQLVAFPMTAMERLVIRAVATHDGARARHVVRRVLGYAALVAVVGSLTVVGLALSGKGDLAVLIGAATVSALSAGLVTTAQAACRASGRLGWGQMPNELLRPAVTILAYPVALAVAPGVSGALATGLASAATLAVLLLMPRDVLPAGEVGLVTDAPAALGAFLLISAVALGVERGYSLVLSAVSGPAEVAAFTVALRVIQLANFGQAFGTFFYSPAVAAALAGPEAELNRVAGLARRVRVVGLLSALPAVVLCLAAPSLVEAVVGGGLDLGPLLAVVSIPVLVAALGGPAQVIMIMAGQERAVAAIYLLGLVVSAGVWWLSGMVGALAATTAMAVAFVTWNVAQVFAARLLLGRWF